METQLLIFGFESKEKKTSSKRGVNFLSVKPASKSKTSEKKIHECKIFVDGAARGNPGPAGAGIHIIFPEREEKGAFFLGEKTNNQAEYLALVLALYLIKSKIDESDLKKIFITIHSDSELLVRQLNGIYKIKNPVLLSLNGLIKQLLKDISHKFIHVYREQNKIADKLSNEGIDKKKKIPTNFLNFLADFNDVEDIVEMLKK